MRLTLRVRPFETQWVTGRSAPYPSWEDAVRHFLKDQWCWNSICGALFDAITGIETRPPPARLSGLKSAAVVEAAFAEAWSNQEGTYGTYSWKPGVVLRLAEDVANAFVAGSVARRQWRALDRAGRTGKDADAWVAARRRAFDVLLNRAVRQRNAIVHGQEFVAEIVDSVEPFLATVGAGLVRHWIDAAAANTSVDAAIEAARIQLRANFDKLHTEPSGLVLYPEA